MKTASCWIEIAPHGTLIWGLLECAAVCCHCGKAKHKLGQGLRVVAVVIQAESSTVLEHSTSNHGQAAVMCRKWSPRPSAGRRVKMVLELTGAVGNMAVPVRGGPRLFSSESGSFYSIPVTRSSLLRYGASTPI